MFPTPLIMGAGGLSLEARLAAYLSGKVAFARDTSDLSTLWQDVDATVPVTGSGQPVGRWDGKYSSVLRGMRQPTASRRPTFDGTGLAFDGSDDVFDGEGLGDFTNNAPAFFHCGRYQVGAVGFRCFLGISNSSSTGVRVLCNWTNNRALAVQARRLNADGAPVIQSADSIITLGVPFVLSVQVDPSVGNDAKIWLNGTLVASGSLSGSAGNFQNNNSVRVREGSNLGTTPGQLMNGWMRRRVDVAEPVSDSDRAMIEEWVGAH